MKFLRILSVAGLLIGTAAGAAQNYGTVSGVIRDANGNPIVNVIIIITHKTADVLTRQITSGLAGEYSFTGLVAGDYQLTASSSGFASSAPTSVHIASAAAVRVDLTLTKTLAPSSSNASGGALQLQASGLHGLIDPGGYSASANADAATGLVRGIADMKRTDTSLKAALPHDLPCSLEPQLQEDLHTHPDQASANRRLGEFYVVHDETGRAIPLLNRALQIDPKDTSAARALAIARMQTGQFEEARKLLTVLAEQHDEAAVHELLARADEGSGNFSQAAQEYRIAYRETPSEQNLLGVGYELLLGGSAADAANISLGGEQKYPKSISLRIGAGVAQFLQGHPADSVHSFLDASDLNPADPRAYPFLLAASSISDTDGERVHSTFKRFLNVLPDNAAANYDYASVLSRDNSGANSEQAEALLKRAVQLDPDMAAAHLQLADLYSERKSLQAAIPEYETAVRLSPDLNAAHYRLAIAYRRAGRTEESTREMQIFQQTKAGQSASGNAEINITQFISVMNPPGQLQGEQRCAATSP